jgi:ribulose-phosphate 3-epimerase
MKIVPAILSENYDDFLFKVRQAESFTDFVQIDIMDGIFVPSVGFPADKLNGLNTSVRFELHLMVQHPSAFMANIDNPRMDKVLFHFESEVKHTNFITLLRKRGIDAGLAVNPGTEIHQFAKIAEHVDTIMFLTVDPCCYGNPFRPEVMAKVREARTIFKNKVIAVDGGVSLENLSLFRDAGVDYVCVGSRIFLPDSPGESYRLFLKRLKELEGVTA